MTTFSNVIRGVAFGDAWGDPAEFQKIDSLTRNNVRGPDLPEHLRITDDTQMTLYLADALDLARYEGADMARTKTLIEEAYLEYYSDPDNNRAPGVTVMGSLGILNQGKTWQVATNGHSDGSGTVMRTSPVAFVGKDWVGIAAFAAAVTHGAANAIAAAILDVAVLREELAGNVAPGALSKTALAMASSPETFGLLDTGEWLEGYRVPGGLKSGFDELARLLKVTTMRLSLVQNPWEVTNDPSRWAGMTGGWRSHETLVIALAAVDMFPTDGWGALRRSVTSDGDSDTIGAVAGALIGASGYEWPKDVFERLEERYQRWIAQEADDYVFVNESK